MSKTIKVFIFFSVVLNLLLVGMVIGHLSHRWGKEHWRQAPFTEAIERLPKEKQAMVKETMKEAFSKGKGLGKEIRKERKEIVKVITAEPFDEAAYDAHVATIHRLRTEQMHLFSDAVKHVAEELTPEERKTLVKTLRQPPWPRKPCDRMPPEERPMPPPLNP